MNCPKCEATLEAINYNGLEIDRCSDCHGIWFDHREDDELKNLKGAAEALDIGDASLGAKHDQMQNISCPRCDINMHHVSHDGSVEIRFERCNECKGSYFDAGEFRIYIADETLDEFESVMSELGSLETGQNLVDG